MKWYNVEEIVEALEDNYPDLDVERMKLSKLHECIIRLLEFEDEPTAATEDLLEEIHEAWLRLREDAYWLKSKEKVL